MRGFLISVSAGTGCYRHIQVQADSTISNLARVILWSMNFVSEKPCEIHMDNRIAGPAADQDTILSSLFVKKGQKFKLIYDPEDPWVFQCSILGPTEDETIETGIVRKEGRAPVQHEDLDRDYDEKSYPFIYPEIQLNRLYKKAGIKPKERERLELFLQAMVVFYNVIPVSKAYEIINEKTGVDRDVFQDYISIRRHHPDTYHVLNLIDPDGMDVMRHYLVSRSIVFNKMETLPKILSGQQGKEWFVPPGDPLISFLDTAYLADVRYTKPLYNFLRNRLHQDDKKASHIVNHTLRDIHDGTSLDIQGILDYMEWYCREKPGFTDTSIQEFIKIYNELYNHTRMAYNCGHTPQEIMKINPPEIPNSLQLGESIRGMLKSGEVDPVEFRELIETTAFPNENIRTDILRQLDEIVGPVKSASAPAKKKVGRNDPCPCGSGKKYKNCCGRPKGAK